jgi:hypothetical protein
MTIDDADEKVTLRDATSGSSRVFICVSLDPLPLMYQIAPRVAATVLIAFGRHDDRIACS